MNKLRNEFGKFFFSKNYIELKNHLFNYNLRKFEVKKAFDSSFSRMKKDRNFLIADIGSGISPVTPVIEKTIFVELEGEAVNFLKSQGFSAIQGDITNLPFSNSSISLIVCSEVLEHVKNYNLALKEISRVLKTGGGAIITVPSHMYLWMDDDSYVGHFRRFNPDLLHKKIEDAGLRVIGRKPIGSIIERYLTWLTVKLARSTPESISKISEVKLKIFKFANTFLFNVARISSSFMSEKNSSIILFVVLKE